MISVDILVGDAWDTSEPHNNYHVIMIPRIGERISIENNAHRVIDITHHGLEDKGGHHIQILVKPETKAASVYATRGIVRV